MTFLNSLFKALAADPGRVVVVDGDTGTQMTADEFTDRVARVARGLKELVTAHDVVALVAPVTVGGLAARCPMCRRGSTPCTKLTLP